MIGKGARLAALVTLIATGACTRTPELRAAWYLVRAGSSTNDDEPPPGTIVVVLVNEGRRSVNIYDVALNEDKKRLTFSNGVTSPKSLETGAIFALPTDLLDKDRHEPCAVPVQLLVRTRSGNSPWRRVKIDGSLPSSLPSEWLAGGRCVHLPTSVSQHADTSATPK